MKIGTPGNRSPRPLEQFEDRLHTQRGFLRSSSDAFDKGNHEEAFRLATHIRTLVHDAGSSTSVLTHLGIKESLSFVDTGVYRHLLDQALAELIPAEASVIRSFGRNGSQVGLVELGDAGHGLAGWYAPLRIERFPRDSLFGKAVPLFNDFQSWWQTPLVEGASGASFSRYNLVTIMANQDGGAHVDARLDKDYQALVLDDLGVYYCVGDAVDNLAAGERMSSALHNVAYASVRQIAFELTVTLDRWDWVRHHPGALALREPCAGLDPPEPSHRPLVHPTPFLNHIRRHYVDRENIAQGVIEQLEKAQRTG